MYILNMPRGNKGFNLPVGTKFGRWTIVGAPERRGQGKNSKWPCRCECGQERMVHGTNLVHGLTRSCGCLRREVTTRRNTLHGWCGTKEYRAWKAAKWRCVSKKKGTRETYLDRGITMSPEWKDNFLAFIEHIGPAPRKHRDVSVDRINTLGNYEPGNVRWATPLQQGQNQRKNRNLTHQGQTHCIAEWARRTSLDAETIAQRLDRGWSVEDSLTTPVVPLGARHRT